MTICSSTLIRGQLYCVLISAAFVGAGCGPSSPRFTTANERSSSLSKEHQLEGIASYYADEFHQRRTANGEVYNMHDLTAAHKTLPFNTKVKVTNLDNNRSVIVRINDRGPFKGHRIIDLSLEAAKRIALIANGTGPVKLEILEIGTSHSTTSGRE